MYRVKFGKVIWRDKDGTLHVAPKHTLCDPPETVVARNRIQLEPVEPSAPPPSSKGRDGDPAPTLPGAGSEETIADGAADAALGKEEDHMKSIGTQTVRTGQMNASKAQTRTTKRPAAKKKVS